MTIQSILSSSYAIPQVSVGTSGSAPGPAVPSAESMAGSTAGQGAAPSSALWPSRAGTFIAAIFSALAQSGVLTASGSAAAAGATAGAASTGTAGAGATPQSGDPVQALGTFLQDLLGALQSAGASANAAGANNAGAGSMDSDGDQDGSGAASAAGTAPGQGHHHHYHGGAGRIESGLHALIQALAGSAGDEAAAAGSTAGGPVAAASSASGSTASATGPLGPATATLSQDFQNLVVAFGGGASQATLPSFLQALAQNLQGVGSSGTVVDTEV